MSTHLSIEKQNPHIARSTYHRFDPFASQTKARPLSTHEFSHILSFLGPKTLERSEKVCRNWARFIDKTGQWKRQCQIQLGLTPESNPTRCLQDSYYKQLIFSNILDENVYERYLGKVIPETSEEISLNQSNEPDPCDPNKKIGDEYVLMDIPTHIKITHLAGFSLDKPDDPKDCEAPKLIRSQGDDWSSGCGAGDPSSGLSVGSGYLVDNDGVIGVAVTFPAEVEAVEP